MSNFEKFQSSWKNTKRVLSRKRCIVILLSNLNISFCKQICQIPGVLSSTPVSWFEMLMDTMTRKYADRLSNIFSILQCSFVLQKNSYLHTINYAHWKSTAKGNKPVFLYFSPSTPVRSTRSETTPLDFSPIVFPTLTLHQFQLVPDRTYVRSCFAWSSFLEQGFYFFSCEFLFHQKFTPVLVITSITVWMELIIMFSFRVS